MSHLMKDWLGPLIEYELKKAVEWKQRASTREPDNSTKDQTIESSTVRDFSDQDFTRLFKDNGSSLSIRCHTDRNKARVVQLLDISMTHTSFKVQLSDGYTAVKAIVTRKAQEALLAENGKDAEQWHRGQQLSIPEFEIKATTLGKMDERVQLTIHCVKVANSMRGGVFGNPVDVHERVAVKKSLAALKEASQGKLDDREISGRNVPLGSQLLQRDMSEGTRYANGNSQSFATQVPVHAQRNNNQKPSAINLAEPIMPARNENTFGSRPATGGATSQPPRNLLSLLPTAQQHPIAVRHGAQSHVDRTDRAPPVQTVTDDATRRGSTSTSNVTRSTSQQSSPIQHRKSSVIDLTSDQEEEEIAQDTVMDDSHSAEDGGEVIGDPSVYAEVENNASPHVDVEQDIQNDVTREEECVPSAECVIDKEEKVQPSPSPEIKPEPQPPESTSDYHASNVSVEQSVQLPWHGITRIRRSHCIVPPDQQSLLDRRESWNPPAPGQQFPTPNVPRVLLEQIESRKGVGAEQDEVQEGLGSSGRQSVAEQDSETDLSRSPSATPAEEQLPWPPSSPYARREELPPDSSALNGGNHASSPIRAMGERVAPQAADIDEDLPPDSPSNDQILKSVENASSQPQAVVTGASGNKLFSADSQRKSRIFSTTVDPGRSQRNHSDNSALLQPSTLSQSKFYSPNKARPSLHSSPMGPPSTRGPLSRGDKILVSTYTPPYSQSAQVGSGALGFDGMRTSAAPMSDFPTTDVDKMAAEQSQPEFSASTQKPLKIQSPSMRLNVPSSPLNRSFGRQEDEMDIEPSTPPQILGKRVPTSPASANGRPRKSRFGFSQEEPVPQNPAWIATAEKRKFMGARKQENRQQSEQVDDRRTIIANQQSRNRPEVDVAITIAGLSSSPPVPPRTSGSARSPRSNVTALATPARYPETAKLSPSIVNTQKLPLPSPQARSEDDFRTIDHKSLHQEFTSTYPDYKGDLRHFTNLVKEVDCSRNPLHQFLWDDYVIRNKTDYIPYSIECLNVGERPPPYEIYYTKRITKPLYTQGILTPDKLDALFTAGNTRPSSSHQATSRAHEGETGWRSPSRHADRYVPPPRSPPPATTAASASPAQRPPKQKNNFLLMSFGPESPSKPRSNARRASNAFAQNNKTPPTGPKNATPAEGPAVPNSIKGGSGGGRSLPWTSSNKNRASDASDYRPSSVADSRRRSTSEYTYFYTSYQSLRSVQGEEGDSEHKTPTRRVNVLGWDL